MDTLAVSCTEYFVYTGPSIVFCSRASHRVYIIIFYRIICLYTGIYLFCGRASFLNICGAGIKFLFPVKMASKALASPLVRHVAVSLVYNLTLNTSTYCWACRLICASTVKTSDYVNLYRTMFLHISCVILSCRPGDMPRWRQLLRKMLESRRLSCPIRH